MTRFAAMLLAASLATGTGCATTSGTGPGAASHGPGVGTGVAIGVGVTLAAVVIGGVLIANSIDNAVDDVEPIEWNPGYD